MNCPDPLAGPLWSHPDDTGEAAAAASDNSSFAYMSGDYSTDDLFVLVCQGGGRGSSTLEQPPVVSRHLSPPPPAHMPEVLRDPPSEDEMAAWLYSIVKGEDHAHEGGDLGRTAHGWYPPPKEPSGTSMATRDTSSADKRETIEITEGMPSKDTGSDSSEGRKTAGGARRSQSHHGEAHNLTEKKRRYKIKERLKTLQQLIPGCDKQSNHASTLDRTIRYMKSLQHQVQAMSGGGCARPAAAVYPAVPPQYVPPPGAPVAVAPMVLGPSPAMVPFGHILPCPHYPAAVMMPAAAPALYPAAAAASRVVYPAAGRHRHGYCSSRGKGCSSILRQKE